MCIRNVRLYSSGEFLPLWKNETLLQLGLMLYIPCCHSSKIQGVHSCSAEDVGTEGPKIPVDAFHRDGIHA